MTLNQRGIDLNKLGDLGAILRSQEDLERGSFW